MCGRGFPACQAGRTVAARETGGAIANAMQKATEALQHEKAAEEALNQATGAEVDALFGDCLPPTSDSSGDHEEAAEDSDGDEKSSETDSDLEVDVVPMGQPIKLSTVADAEGLLDAVAQYAEKMSAWGCCGGLRDGRHYFCDTCRQYFHLACKPNMSKVRQAPLCPDCHLKATEGGDRPRTRRRVQTD